MGFSRLHISLLILIALSCISCNKTVFKKRKPNVLIIVTDDQGWGDVGFNGNKIIETPVLDSMAKKSVIFNRFYVSPESKISRNSLLTGKYYLSEKSRDNGQPQQKEKIISEVYKENGYQTICVGKWYFKSELCDNPLNCGFDQFIGFRNEDSVDFFNAILECNGKSFNSKGYLTDVLTDTLITLIKNSRKPFFSYLSFNTPHIPYQLPESYFSKYLNKGLDNKTASVYGMCENLDNNFRKIIHALENEREIDNTIIVFMSDNGPDFIRYNGGLKGWKDQVDEGGLRVPFFISYNKGSFIARRIKDDFAAHIDLFPTLLDLCDIDIKEQRDGVSFSKLLKMTTNQVPARNFYTYYNNEVTGPQGAVRTREYLLTITSLDTSLYNLKNDPFQKKNLLKEEEDIAKLLLKDYLNWLLAQDPENQILRVKETAVLN